MCLPSYLLSKYVPWMLHPPSQISLSVQGIVHFTTFHSFKNKTSLCFQSCSFCLVFACVICKRLYMLTRATDALKQWSLTTIRSNIIYNLAKQRASEDIQRLPKFVWPRMGQQSNLNSIGWPWSYSKNASDSACVCDIQKVLTQGKRS